MKTPYFFHHPAQIPDRLIKWQEGTTLPCYWIITQLSAVIFIFNSVLSQSAEEVMFTSAVKSVRIIVFVVI